MTYFEAIERFGVDNPDMRFGMELFTADWGNSEFVVVSNAIKNGGVVRGIVVKGGASISRKVVDKQWVEFVRNYRLGGLLWGKYQNGAWSGSLKKVEAELLEQIPGVEDGDLVLLALDLRNHVNTAIGRLRAHVPDISRLYRKIHCFCMGN